MALLRPLALRFLLFLLALLSPLVLLALVVVLALVEQWHWWRAMMSAMRATMK